MHNKALLTIGFLEGISLLFLLFIAMPLKYLYNNPDVVPYAGMIHGILFLLFVAVLFAASHKNGWSVWWFLGGLLAAVLPFGTFVFDWRVKKWLAHQG